MEDEAKKWNVTPDGPEMWMFHQCRSRLRSSGSPLRSDALRDFELYKYKLTSTDVTTAMAISSMFPRPHSVWLSFLAVRRLLTRRATVGRARSTEAER